MPALRRGRAGGMPALRIQVEGLRYAPDGLKVAAAAIALAGMSSSGEVISDLFLSWLYLNKAREKMLADEQGQEPAVFFRAADGDRPTYPDESLMVHQIRTAISVRLQVAPLHPAARRKVLARAAWEISYTRSRNVTAKRSHRKTTLRQLHRRGLFLDKTRT